MTIKLLHYIGIETSIKDHCIYLNPINPPKNTKILAVEADWSAASYWYEIACINPHLKIHLPRLNKDSWQGDAQCAEFFKLLGVQTKFYEDKIIIQGGGKLSLNLQFDLTHHPDLFPALCISCVLLEKKAIFTGISHLIYKESNRMIAIGKELAKIGVQVSQNQFSFQISSLPPSPWPEHLIIETYQDHRIAMAFAPLAFKQSITINNPSVVEKSYPEFWKHLLKFSSQTQPFKNNLV